MQILGWVIALIVFAVIWIPVIGAEHENEYRFEYGYKHFGMHDI